MFFLCTKHNFSNGTQSCPHCEKERGDKVTIDTKRLATDPGYWGELGAPDDATHAANRHDKQPGREFRVCWYRKDQGFYFRYPESDGWEPCANGEPAHQPIIPRPQKPEVEWDGEGLPPVGCECEVVSNRMWVGAKVIGYDGPACVVAIDGEGYEGSRKKSDFRPLRTKEQREREGLISLLSEYSFDIGSDYESAGDAILSRYNLEPKDA